MPRWQEAQAARAKSREVPRAAKWWWHVPPQPALKEDSSAKLLTDQALATGAFQGKDIPKMETRRNTLSLHFWTSYRSDGRWRWGKKWS